MTTEAEVLLGCVGVPLGTMAAYLLTMRWLERRRTPKRRPVRVPPPLRYTPVIGSDVPIAKPRPKRKRWWRGTA